MTRKSVDFCGLRWEQLSDVTLIYGPHDFLTSDIATLQAGSGTARVPDRVQWQAITARQINKCANDVANDVKI